MNDSVVPEIFDVEILYFCHPERSVGYPFGFAQG